MKLNLQKTTAAVLAVLFSTGVFAANNAYNPFDYGYQNHKYGKKWGKPASEAEGEKVIKHAAYHSGRLIQKNLVVFDFAPYNGKNKYLRLSEKGIEVFKIHKEQQAYIEESVFSVLNNYSEEELQTVVKLMDDIENVWGGLPW